MLLIAKGQRFAAAVQAIRRQIWTMQQFLQPCKGVWGKLDSLFATFHSRVIGNGKYWSDGWGESQQIAHLIATHSRRFGPERAGSLYCNSDDIPDIKWTVKSKAKLGRTVVHVQEGEFASPVQVKTFQGLAKHIFD